MLKQLTCIVCPLGCRVSAELQSEKYVFSGNSCSQGAEFAERELTAPKRSLTTTVRTVFPDTPVIPVRTNTDIPKHLIPDVIKQLAYIKIKDRIGIGTIVVNDILEIGCDIIVTSNILVEDRRATPASAEAPPS